MIDVRTCLESKKLDPFLIPKFTKGAYVICKSKASPKGDWGCMAIFNLKVPWIIRKKEHKFVKPENIFVLLYEPRLFIVSVCTDLFDICVVVMHAPLPTSPDENVKSFWDSRGKSIKCVCVATSDWYRLER